MSRTINRTIFDNVCTITFDQPKSAANVLNEKIFGELNEQLDFIEEHEGTLRGVVFTSAKKSIFIAGADLNAFASNPDEERVEELILMGQETFNRIEDLKIPTVAAIHGACLGGGYELALACDHRVASADSATKIGLPETMLGILPAWGGSTRLPRLIGLPSAMGIILAGSVVVAKKALKLGMVNKVVFKENLQKSAVACLYNGKKKYKKLWSNKFPISTIARRKATQNVMKKTNGLYPAPLEAIDVMVDGLAYDRSGSLELERGAFKRLLKTDVAENLVGVFFLQERSKKTKGKKGYRTHKSAVIGAGVMGAGIAQWVSSRGIPTILKDIKPEFVANGMKTIGKLYGAAVSKRVMTQTEAQSALDRITPLTDTMPMTQVDFVVEAAVEKLDIKKKLFLELEQNVRADTVLATNTSALSIDVISEGMEHPERVVGVHFFNPVHKMKLVEIVKGGNTSDETVGKAVEFTKQIGKLPVVVKDSPGFLVNRILMPYLIEAVHLASVGVEVERVDKLLRDFGMPMGPFRLIDEVGGDVCQHVADDLLARLDTKFPNSNRLRQMIENGDFGKKTGRGFYIYKNGRSSGVNENYKSELMQLPISDEGIVDRLVLIMVNEAVRCLQEEIVASPRDIDFGMIMGTGWAPFRGGPMRYLDSEGALNIFNRLKELEKKSKYFKPCELLSEYSNNDKKFYEER
jgi:3-hydroxyacyl-CoA dehydrogenase / enoyl-CoA hydratase / 3-hydroxybutyryl-CoA epimerase